MKIFISVLLILEFYINLNFNMPGNFLIHYLVTVLERRKLFSYVTYQYKYIREKGSNSYSLHISSHWAINTTTNLVEHSKSLFKNFVFALYSA